MVTIGKNAIVATKSRSGNGFNIRFNDGICYIDGASYDRLMSSNTLLGVKIDDEKPNVLKSDDGRELTTYPLAGLTEDTQMVMLDRANKLIAAADGVDSKKLESALKVAASIESLLA
jgi:hypothetical protein